MSRPAFLQKEPLTRMGLAFLLTVGIVAPLLLALDLGGQMLLALAEALGLLVLLTTLYKIGLLRKAGKRCIGA